MNKLLNMHKHELLEFYQLINLYKTTYKDDSLDKLLIDVEILYGEITHTDIKQQSNPRQAGRKTKYTEEQNQQIIDLRKSGVSLRNIANETGFSLGHIQTVLKK